MKNNLFKIRTLTELMKNKGDIFTFIRLSAAFLVLYAHSYHIFGLGADPLTRILGVYTGTLAVYIFFAISGFFIFQSAIKRSFVEYTIARLTRIFPGLFVANVITIFVIIPLTENIPLHDFLLSNSTWNFIKTNSLLDSIIFTLPDIYAKNPDHAINGSLWTLPVEIRAYIGALLLVYIGISTVQSKYNAFFIILLIIDNVFPDFFASIFPIPGAVGLMYAFCVGGLLYINRMYIPVSLFLTLATIVIVVLFYKLFSSSFLLLLLAYIIISIGYLLSAFRPLCLKNDYSYGLYLYAYPISQMSYALLSEYGFVFYFLFICCATFVMAFFSWHCIERPIALFARTKIIPYFSLTVKKFTIINGRDV